MALPSGTGYADATATNPSSSLTDFTTIVDLSKMPSDWWSAVDTSDATKGRAAIDSGPTEVPVDWIDFDNTGQAGWARIKWSGTLSNSGTQKLRIYPPKAANRSYAAGDTFGQHNAYDSNFEAYWPFDGDHDDRTANGHDLSVGGGTPTFASSQVNRGVDLEEDDSEYLDSDATFPTLGQAGGVLAWYQPEAIGPPDEMICGVGIHTLGMRVDAGRIFFSWSDAGRETVGTNSGLSSGTWTHCGAMMDNTGSSAYRNGVDDTNFTNPGAVTSRDSESGTMGVGAALDEGPGFFADGIVDELQVHNAVRSSDWIAHEYAQTNDQNSFWNLGGGTWTWNGAGVSYPPFQSIGGLNAITFS